MADGGERAMLRRPTLGISGPAKLGTSFTDLKQT
jgi:hypothetical protein